MALTLAVPAAWGQTVGLSQTNALHQALHLSTAQEAGWKVYRAQSSAANPAQDRRRAAAQMFPSLTAPQRLDLVAAEMRQELADLDQQSQGLKAFYQTLSPEQQKVFDTQTLPPADTQQQSGQ